MNCPKCNSNISQEETFCKVCGYSFNQTQQPHPSNYSQVPTWDWNVNPTLQNTNNNNVLSTNFQNPTTNQAIQQNYSSHTGNINNSNIENNNMQNNSMMQSSNQMNIQNNVQQEQQIKPQTVFNTNYSQNILNDDLYKEDMLIDAYIGKKADRLKNGGFSWGTFFGGIIYIFYRKMWGFGIVLFIINFIINLLSNIIPFSQFEIVTNTIAGLIAAKIFKEQYLMHVKNKIEKIKSKNPNKTHEELLNICRKKGGTTIIPIILIILMVLVCIIPSIITTINIDKKAQERYDEIYENNDDILNTKKYTLDELNFEVPTIFKLRTHQSNKYTSSYNTSSSTCDLSISSTDSNNYNSIEQYIESNRSFKNDTSMNTIQEKNINNNVWNYLFTTIESDENNEKNNLITHFYAISKENKIYSIEIIILKDENNVCSKAKEIIINSLNFN